MSPLLFDISNKAIGSGKKAKNSISIYVDRKAQTVHFYLMPSGDKSAISYESHTFRSPLFDASFFRALTEMTSNYASAHPEVPESDITLVLPDFLFAADVISLPNLGRRKTDDSLQVMLDTMYKNRAELEINTMPVQPGKKVAAYATVAFSRTVRASFVSACAAGNMTPDRVTFRSAAFSDAVSLIDSKYANASYLMLDIQQTSSSFIFVTKGRAAGFYSLPFGYKILQRASVAAENLLIGHDTAELAVMNAKEKAKAKQLTMMRTAENPEAGTDDTAATDLLAMNTDDPTVSTAFRPAEAGELPRKAARSVPKFMQRPAPKTPEEITYENFTVFMKWALNLIDNNDKLTSAGYPETVLVHLPDDCAHVIDTANLEEEENGISFTKLSIPADFENFREHIELFGGLSASQMNKINYF